MSSTNRGAERRANDHYETPGWLTRLLLAQIGRARRGDPAFFPSILEPAAGSGAITREIQAYWPGARVREIDLVRTGENFLTTPPRAGFDMVIGNPPFSAAFDFVRRAGEWVNQCDSSALVAMLLPLNFLGSKERSAWLRDYPPCVLVSPQRPSFTGTGTDSINYAWMLWSPNIPAGHGIATLKILDLPTPEEVKADNAKIRAASASRTGLASSAVPAAVHS